MNASGIIQSMRRDRKAFQLDDGNWYSSFTPFPSHVDVGVHATFAYVEKNGFKNVKGSVSAPVLDGKPGPTPTPTTWTSTPSATALKPTLPDHYEDLQRYATLVKSFPVPPTHPDRAIIRQNSLTNAVATMQTMLAINDKAMEGKDLIAETLAIASRFEKFSTGDIEREEAMKEINNVQ